MKKHLSLLFAVSLIFVLPAAAQNNPISEIKKKIQVGGADAPTLPGDREQKFRCELKSGSGVHRILFNTLSGESCLIKIPLNEADLTHKSILSFAIRGERDVQYFTVGMQAAGQTEFVSAIYEYLPRSVVSDWHVTGVPIREFSAKKLNLAKSEYLLLDFNQPAEGVLEIKEISFAPLKPFSENWEPIVVLLNEYGLNRISDFKTMSLGHYGEEFGWKIAQIYKTSPSRSFASGEIQPLSLQSRTPPIRDGISKIADFNDGLENNVDGLFNEFQKLPSTGFITLSSKVYRGGSGKSLKIIYDKKKQGFCGAWVHFFSMRKPPRERLYFNATPYAWLSFWVRGEKGGEDVGIQLADAGWEKTEDSVYYGKVSDYLKGVTTEWQQVRVPLKQEFYKNIKFSKLAGLTLNFREEGRGVIYVDDIAFVTPKGGTLAESSPAEPKRGVASTKKYYKAIWLWHTIRQLKNRPVRKELYQFCKKEGVNLIFFQIQQTLKKLPSGEFQAILQHEDQLRDFISEARKYGIEVHALDGFSRFALEPWHEKVLAGIRAIIDYNKRVRPQERFTGIHHDNEPYLIPGYWGHIREGVMREYLKLCEVSQKMVRDSGLPDFVFGVDIPFWYEEANFDYDVPVEVTWKGVQKPASFHIIDIVDNVGIMDYRTKAYGADGTLIHGRDEVLYANKVGKKILIGLETYPLPHEIFAVFRYNRLAELSDLTTKIRNDSRQLFMFLDQYRGLGILYLRRFRDDLKDTPEKMAKDIIRLRLDGKQTIYKTEIGVDVPSSKLSFAGMERDYFLEIYEDTFNFFSEEPSFYGMAIHYYETYREMMEKG